MKSYLQIEIADVLSAEDLNALSYWASTEDSAKDIAKRMDLKVEFDDMGDAHFFKDDDADTFIEL